MVPQLMMIDRASHVEMDPRWQAGPEQDVACREGDGDRDQGGDPDQVRLGVLEVELLVAEKRDLLTASLTK